jgi:hypothetical protein
MALGHAPIHAMAWSSAFQAVVVCSFSHFAPIRVLGYTAEQPQVALNPPSPEAAAWGKVIEGRIQGQPQGVGDC